MIKSLIVGYGSIGKRHIRILNEMGHDVYIVSRHLENNKKCYKTIELALTSQEFDYIVIANKTFEHYETLNKINQSNFNGILLIEKPIFSKFCNIQRPKFTTYIAYNLRFHPLIQETKRLIEHEQVLSINAYVGQYLPSWRPGTDYSKSYSAFASLGGGVIRDLSHELDYLSYLFGSWRELIAFCGKISDLKIQSEDYCQVMYNTENNIKITLELNYLDRIVQRYYTIQTNNKTIKVDLINNQININGNVIQYPKIDRDYTYLKQHEHILSNSEIPCTFEEGLKIIEMIEAIERSSKDRKWIKNE